MSIRIVTAYTPDYKRYADKLTESASHFDVPITAFAFDSLGSWKRNNAIKPSVLLDTMNKTGDDVLWLDADMFLIGWPDAWPQGDVLAKYSNPPEAQIFDFATRKNVSNVLGVPTIWGGHILFRRGTESLLQIWAGYCSDYWEDTNDEQCLMEALASYDALMQTSGFPAVTISKLDPSFIVHRPIGRDHGKPGPLDGWL